MTQPYDYCEFRRHNSDIVYKYDRVQNECTIASYKRRDKPLWIVFTPLQGWAVVDEAQTVLSWPLDEQLAKKETYPPASDWVSQKAGKSYVYSLVFPAAEVGEPGDLNSV